MRFMTLNAEVVYTLVNSELSQEVSRKLCCYQGSADNRPQAKSDTPPVLINRYHWNTVIPINIHIVYGCLRAAELLSSCA